ncbi:hypothetical protein [Endozoicomonas arenosclerae]|uniref:hypothetical protein n=1 Tax=Endozoicomonas arenosclerae TaxID=1633495 RepID=UPI000785F311|nr:hypothetical protein [Endozoicomonas arenosclerae]
MSDQDTSNYDNLVSFLQAKQALGTSINDSVTFLVDNTDPTVKNVVDSATINDWAKAIHTVWIKTITLSQLVEGLGKVNRFSSEDINTTANIYFLEIQIEVDTASILSQHNKDGSSNPIFVDSYIKMTSNHVSTTSGQGTNELDTEELVPNESIEWTAVSKNGSDTIQLKRFHASPINPNADFKAIISDPVPESGSSNKYSSYVIQHPQPDFRKAYSFDFTINNGTQLFTFDPWLGDLSKP